MSDLDPGREEELRRLRRWLAFSERLDRLIEASETRPAFRPAPVLANAPARHAHGEIVKARLKPGLLLLTPGFRSP